MDVHRQIGPEPVQQDRPHRSTDCLRTTRRESPCLRHSAVVPRPEIWLVDDMALRNRRRDAGRRTLLPLMARGGGPCKFAEPISSATLGLSTAPSCWHEGREHLVLQRHFVIYPAASPFAVVGSAGGGLDSAAPE